MKDSTAETSFHTDSYDFMGEEMDQFGSAEFVAMATKAVCLIARLTIQEKFCGAVMMRR